jgi:N-acetylglucosaminyldiphosphoundecaprenol N-acetyl-beta-D-mannosaminyltransferase
MKVLGIKIDNLTKNEVQETIIKWLKADKTKFIVTANAEMYYRGFKNQEFSEILNNADLNIPDSVGIGWAIKHKYQQRVEIYPGVELCEWLINLNEPVYILGASPEVLAKIDFPAVVEKQDGYYDLKDEDTIINNIKQRKPKILMVALGAERQERFIDKCKEQLNVSIMIGVGGSIDVLSGAKQRAPKIFRQFKMEWFYRLLREPLRIFRIAKLFNYWLAVMRDKEC